MTEKKLEKELAGQNPLFVKIGNFVVGSVLVFAIGFIGSMVGILLNESSETRRASRLIEWNYKLVKRHEICEQAYARKMENCVCTHKELWRQSF